MGLSILESVRRQVKAQEEKIKRFEDLYEEFSKNKSARETIGRMITRAKHKIIPARESLLQLESGMAFTADGWVERT